MLLPCLGPSQHLGQGVKAPAQASKECCPMAHSYRRVGGSEDRNKAHIGKMCSASKSNSCSEIKGRAHNLLKQRRAQGATEVSVGSVGKSES